MAFRWQVFKVQVPAEGKSMQDSLHSDISGLGNTLFGEVAKAATETWHRCYAGKIEINAAAAPRIALIRHKKS